MRVHRLTSTVVAAAVVATAAIVGSPIGPAHANGPVELSVGPSAPVSAATTVGTTTYLGGPFEGFGRQSGGGAQVGATGSGDVAVTFPSVDGNVVDVVADGSDGWYLVGDFARVGNYERPGLARILANGAVDEAFEPPPVVGDYATIAFDGTNVVVGGSFIGFGDDPESPDFVVRANIAQLDGDGELTEWAPTVGQPYDPDGELDGSRVSALLLDGGALYIGGIFSEVDGQGRSGLAVIDYHTGAVAPLWNPALLAVWDPDPEAPTIAAQVNSLAKLGGSLYVVGGFTSVNAVSRSNAVALSADPGGSAIVQGWNPSPNAPVAAIEVHSGDLLLGGSFTRLYSYEPEIDDQPDRQRIAKVDSTTGSVDPFFVPQADSDVTDLAAFGNNVYVAGSFTNIGGTDAPRSARLNATTGGVFDWEPMPLGHAGQGLTPVVNALAVNNSQNAVYLGGTFRVINGTSKPYLAVVDSTGQIQPESLDLNGQPTYIEHHGGHLYISGVFDEANGIGTDGLVRVATADLAVDASWLPEIDLPVNALLFDDDSDSVYMGGMFTEVNNQQRNYVAALALSDGALKPWNPDATDQVTSLTWSPTGDIVVGGSFYAQYPTEDEPVVNPGIGGKERTYIAEIDADGVATDWEWALDGPVASVQLVGEDLFLTGGFESINTHPASGLALVEFATGDVVPGLPEIAGAVEVFQVIDDIIYIAGDFTSVADEPRNGLAAIDPTSGLPTSWAPAVNGPVSVIAGDDLIYLGGQFTMSGPESNAWFGLLAPKSLPGPFIVEYGPMGGIISGGTEVTFLGAALDDAVVTFDGIEADIDSNTSNEVVAVSPPHAAGSVELVLQTAGGLVRYIDGFTYYDGPVITDIEPAVGPLAGGNEVIVSGENLAGTDSVMFGDEEAEEFWYFEDEGYVSVEVPESIDAGAVDVYLSNPAGDFTAPDAYEYLASPTVASITPQAGPTAGSTLVTIQGTALTHANRVDFGVLQGTQLTVVNDQTLTVLTPTSGSGSVDVTIETPGGTVTVPDGFTFVSSPSVLNVSPSSGTEAGGSEVTISGTNLGIVDGVTFGGIPAASFTVVNPSTVTAVTPAGSPGLVNVAVTTPGGTATLANGYRYVGTPVISTVTPDAGPVAGGNPIEISGSNLGQASAVTVGGNPASFQQNSSTRITAYPPGGAAGPVSVAVTTPGGTTELADAYTYVEAPTIDAVTPQSGSSGGGSTVTITGTHLDAVGLVDFGGSTAMITESAPTSLTVTTAPHAPGVVDVEVSSPGGKAAVAGAFEYVPGPSIEQVAPNSGPQSGGTTVEIAGERLEGTDSVTFGGAVAQIVEVQADRVIVVTPESPQAGPVAVALAGEDGTAQLSDGFTYVAAPDITEVSPTEGQLGGGDSVVITGTNLAAATEVAFGNGQAEIVNNTDTAITVLTPAQPAGLADVTVTTTGGAATLADGFDYLPGPSIADVSPAGGPAAGGNQVTITGTGLADPSRVAIGGVDAEIVSSTDTELVVIAAPRAVGLTNLLVETPGGVNTRSDSYRYTGIPSIQTVSPSAGPLTGGQTVTITGTNLWGAHAVTLAGVAASTVTVTSGTQITVVSGESVAASGTVVVNGFGGQATSATSYVYTPQPTVGEVSPDRGPTSGGQSVTITGANMSGVSSVTLGGKSATIVEQSPTTLTVVTPDHDLGTVSLTLAGPGGDVTVPDAYEYVLGPTIDSISPPSGPVGGTSGVEIVGSGFHEVTDVRFGSISAENFDATSDLIVVDAPPQASAGAVDVWVVTAAGSATAANGFTYMALPQVTSIVPNEGSTGGGNTITLTGTSLAGTTAVNFGGSPGTIVSVSNNSIVVTTPAGTAGPVNVSVSSPGGNVPNIGTFTFVQPPQLSSVAPSNGSTSGGTTVTLTGIALQGVSKVTFGGSAAQVVGSTSTTLTVVTPPRPAGPADVMVESGGGKSTLSGSFAYIAPVPPNPPLPADMRAVVANAPDQLGRGKPYTFQVETRSGGSASAEVAQTAGLVAANGYVVVSLSGGVECTAVIANGVGRCTVTVPKRKRVVVSTRFFHPNGQPAGVASRSPAVRVTPVAITSVKRTIRKCAVRTVVRGVSPRSNQRVAVQVRAGGSWATYRMRSSNRKTKWKAVLRVDRKKFKVRAVVGKQRSAPIQVRVKGKLCR